MNKAVSLEQLSPLYQAYLRSCEDGHNKENLSEYMKPQKKAMFALEHLYRNAFAECCRNEINKLAQATEQKHFKVVFMRGITLADDIYPDPNARTFWDIDILVHTNCTRGAYFAILKVCSPSAKY